MRIALALVALVPTLASADEPAGEVRTEPTQQPTPAAPDPADGGGSYFAPPKGRDIVVTSQDDRPLGNVIALASVGGASVLAGAVGLYYNLDARSKAQELSAHSFTGQTWDAAHQSDYDEVHSSSVKAGIFYSIGGVLLLGTIIGYIVTEPKTDTTIIHPHVDPKPTALVAPTRGGALVGGTWRF
jgi:hypothetical protein